MCYCKQENRIVFLDSDKYHILMICVYALIQHTTYVPPPKNIKREWLHSLFFAKCQT